MVDVLPNALFLRHLSCKAIEKNLGQVKGSALHYMVQNELVGIGQEVFRALFVGIGNEFTKAVMV